MKKIQSHRPAAVCEDVSLTEQRGNRTNQSIRQRARQRLSVRPKIKLSQRLVTDPTTQHQLSALILRDQVFHFQVLLMVPVLTGETEKAAGWRLEAGGGLRPDLCSSGCVCVQIYSQASSSERRSDGL